VGSNGGGEGGRSSRELKDTTADSLKWGKKSRANTWVGRGSARTYFKEKPIWGIGSLGKRGKSIMGGVPAQKKKADVLCRFEATSRGRKTR